VQHIDDDTGSGYCIVKHAYDMVYPEGGMLLKVNATSQIGRAESKVVDVNLYYHSKYCIIVLL